MRGRRGWLAGHGPRPRRGTAGRGPARWAGLGYNRRAVNLHRAAQVIVERHAGAVPSSLGELEALPGRRGIHGRAVAAIAYRLPVGPVDTNVRRVLGRIVSGGPEAFSGSAMQALADFRRAHGSSRRVDARAHGPGRPCVQAGEATLCGLPRDLLVQVRLGGATRGRLAGRSCRLAGRSRRVRAARAGADLPVTPFTATRRWLRGRIIDRARSTDDEAWVTYGEAIGSHPATAVREAVLALASEGLLEAREGPDGPERGSRAELATSLDAPPPSTTREASAKRRTGSSRPAPDVRRGLDGSRLDQTRVGRVQWHASRRGTAATTHTASARPVQGGCAHPTSPWQVGVGHAAVAPIWRVRVEYGRSLRTGCARWPPAPPTPAAQLRPRAPPAAPTAGYPCRVPTRSAPLPADDPMLASATLDELAVRWAAAAARTAITAEAMTGADLKAQALGTPGGILMEHAGTAVAAAARALVAFNGREGKPVLILAGPGNNGGDGFVAARGSPNGACR